MTDDITTFGKIEEEHSDYDSSNILLQSIPYDGTSTWGKGADEGFHAFMEAAEHMELYDIETDTEVYTEGIHILDAVEEDASAVTMVNSVHEKTQQLLKSDKFLTFFGGEHSVSIGIIKAFYEAFSDITILQIDAHTDLRSSYMGSPYNHACALYDASKNANLVQVGIRSMDVSEKEHLDPQQCYFAEDIYGGTDWMSDSTGKMTDRVYITFDLDAFDPSIMPATGTPEPGGLDWNTTIRYLRQVFAEKEVLGFDIVELSPIEGMTAPNFLAAKLYYKMLSYKFWD